ncbi:hypothetical protein GWI33_019493 [Rhynchophorus ferrugineus]|uniref:Uncharacterized protein n=1 Tax=Rhynchophorus ferrugineus TaxID=354439 RepID=A0A834HRH3_RHYFE|nr:hypothetical protein GWI33_019493 [Rhynchophorus ferrugineus]
MLTRRAKFRYDDEDVRSQRSHYTNVSKAETSTSKNVELCLEVEMDDEVRDIIKSPDKCQSALLDVTVIKPKGLDKFTTEKQTLKTEEVRQLIASMNLTNDGKKELIKKLFGANEDKHYGGIGRRKTCLSRKGRCSAKRSSVKMEQGDVLSATDVQSVVCSLHNQKGPSRYIRPHQQIYTTPKTYDNIRQMFACTNKDKDRTTEKPDQPCLCQNCAIVGILTDSQKKPFATEPIPETKPSQEKFRKPARKKSVAFKHANDFPSTSNDHQQCHAAIDILSARITNLEQRIAIQEEKAVPKDYFKKIITKLVNHLTKLTHYTTEDKSSVYSQRRKDNSMSYNQYKPQDKQHRFFTGSALISNTFKSPAEKELEPKECASTEPPKSPSDGLWRWGGDVLTSGRDFKNKVVMLLEETLQNLKKGWEKVDEQKKDDLQSFEDKLSLNLARTTETKRKETKEKDKLQKGDYKKTQETRERIQSKLRQTRGPSVNVAYVNPEVTRWPEESSASFPVESTDGEVHREKMTENLKRTHKKHFLKILEKTNTSDRYRLWQSIYNRAIDNHQSKKDTVTVQIPDPKDRRKMIPIEFTIEDLEKILTSVKETNRQ